jgi:hypothetical protein
LRFLKLADIARRSAANKRRGARSTAVRRSWGVELGLLVDVGLLRLRGHAGRPHASTATGRWKLAKQSMSIIATAAPVGADAVRWPT